MRLIDADELKYKNLAEVNGKLTYVLTAEEIDNAQTVDISGNEYFPFRTAYFNGVKDGRATARPQGEWLEDKVAFHFVCNQCGCALRQLKSEVFEGDYDYNFCPNCGESMKPKADQLRECENCIHHSDNGCEVWKCEFEKRSDL